MRLSSLYSNASSVEDFCFGPLDQREQTLCSPGTNFRILFFRYKITWTIRTNLVCKQKHIAFSTTTLRLFVLVMCTTGTSQTPNRALIQSVHGTILCSMCNSMCRKVYLTTANRLASLWLPTLLASICLLEKLEKALQEFCCFRICPECAQFVGYPINNRLPSPFYPWMSGEITLFFKDHSYPLAFCSCCICLL